uniref:Leishmanolysin-like peptidase n=1 Tax=Anisakis simplex TaxID=6269 RepID=A0A0M3JY20_ANISI
LKRQARQTNLSSEYQPLRIHLHYDNGSISLLTSLLPDAVGYWTSALSVRRKNAPIRLNRKCLSNHYYIRPNEKSQHQSCVMGCKRKTTCGEIVVPEEHLFQCRYCSSPNPYNCIASGPNDGPGVENADFLLYVSAVLSDRCKNIDTVAYAAHCQQEADFDRPIAGHVNLCPNALSTQTHDQEVLLSTVKHEILHALGFSAGLYAFFRDDNGNPRTKRNRYNKPLSLNRERGYYDWDSNTVKTIMRDDWWTADGIVIPLLEAFIQLLSELFTNFIQCSLDTVHHLRVSHPVHMMVTPRVMQEVRRHFNCDHLEGAELENQGGDGTAFTHWEKRLFENEAMTGTHTQNPVYSRLTLALLEDSGWYRANYSVAENLHWGKGLGCEFAQKSCGEWINKRSARSESIFPYCNEIKHDGKRSLATTRCTAQRDSLALCNLIPYREILPKDYQNFEKLEGVQAAGVKHYGGSVELADFCPYNQEFEWKGSSTMSNSNSSAPKRRDSRCEIEGNIATSDETNSILELYGSQSGCFDLATAWTERKCSRIRTDLSMLFTYQIVNGWLREGVIICPSCADFCTPELFPADDKYGECLAPIQLPNDTHIGDEPIKEPCSAFKISTNSLLYILVVLVIISVNQ